MANPQTENGFTRIANELLAALASIRIPGEAMQVLLVIVRKTYGFNKSADAIPLSQFTKATGISRQNVQRAIKKLLDMNLIHRKYCPTQKRGSLKDEAASEMRQGATGSYGLNKNYANWNSACLKNEAASKQIINYASKTRHSKDTITKDINTPSISHEIGEQNLPFLDEHDNISAAPAQTAKKAKPAKSDKPKLNGWAIWVDINREFERTDPAALGPDLAAAKTIAANAIDRQDLEDLYRLYLSDNDQFLVKLGHSLRNMTGRLNKYINTVESIPAGFGAHPAEQAIIDKIEEEVRREQEAARAKREEREATKQ